jgi:hypothetical protein
MSGHIATESKMSCASTYSPANTSRSMLPRVGRFGDLRRRILNWWRSAKISVSSEARDRNSPTNANQINLQRPIIGRTITRFAGLGQPFWVCGKNNSDLLYNKIRGHSRRYTSESPAEMAVARVVEHARPLAGANGGQHAR